MQGARAGDHQQTVILAIKDVTNSLAMSVNGLGLSVAQWQAFAQLSRCRQGLGAAGGTLGGRSSAGKCSYSGSHFVASLAGAVLPPRHYLGVRSSECREVRVPKQNRQLQ